jgi:hypothetical protein
VRRLPDSRDVNTEAEEATALETVTRQPEKTQQSEKTLSAAVVNCRVCGSAIALDLFVVTICKCSIIPITNPNPVCSQSRDSMLVL